MNRKNSNTTGNKNVAQPRSGTTSRRTALKAALAGGAVVTAGTMPTKWVSPVVDSVLLPVHATTSQVTGPWFGQLVVTDNSADVTDNPADVTDNSAKQDNLLYASINNSRNVLETVFSSITDTLIEPANAQRVPEGAFLLCVKRTNNNGGIQVTYQLPTGLYLLHFKGSGSFDSLIPVSAERCPESVSVNPLSFIFTEGNGNLEYKFFISRVLYEEGVLAPGHCNLMAEVCPSDGA